MSNGDLGQGLATVHDIDRPGGISFPGLEAPTARENQEGCCGSEFVLFNRSDLRWRDVAVCPPQLHGVGVTGKFERVQER